MVVFLHMVKQDQEKRTQWQDMIPNKELYKSVLKRFGIASINRIFLKSNSATLKFTIKLSKTYWMTNKISSSGKMLNLDFMSKD